MESPALKRARKDLASGMTRPVAGIESKVPRGAEPRVMTV